MFIAALIIIVKKVETQMSFGFIYDKYFLWHICTTEHYTATTNNKLLGHRTTTRMNLRYVVLSERRQTQKLQGM